MTSYNIKWRQTAHWFTIESPWYKVDICHALGCYGLISEN